MEENNNLLEESHMDSSYQLKVKIKFLQEEKQKLEISNNEMKENIQLMRSINKELAKTHDFSQQALANQLSEQNLKFENAYLRLMNENSMLDCRNLMLQQIIQENENEYREILKGYQSKIIELRRSIQFKEACIQSYEQNGNCSQNFYVGNLPTSTIIMMFLNESEQYKQTIYQLETKNKQLESQLQSLIRKTAVLQQQKDWMESLLSSREGFKKFRERRMLLKRPKSLNTLFGQTMTFINSQSQSIVKIEKPNLQKQSTFKGQNSKVQKETMIQQPQQTKTSCNFTSGHLKLNQLKEQLKKSKTDYSKLLIAFKKQSTKRKENDQKIKVLLDSNKKFKEKKSSSIQELEYYKKATLDLMKLIEKRKIKKSYSTDKTQVQSIIRNIRSSHKIQHAQSIKYNQEYWTGLRDQLNSRISNFSKYDLLASKNRSNKKSLSDILDYAQLWCDEDLEKSEIQNYSKKSKGKTSNSPKIDNQMNPLDDFSRILSLGSNQDFLDEQTFIIKPKAISYAERKKIRNNFTGTDALQLTVIKENVL